MVYEISLKRMELFDMLLDNAPEKQNIKELQQ